MKIVIAALNQILGAANFVIFSMPEGFKIKLIGEMPEINSFIKVNDIKWITDGSGNYVLSYENKGALMEISAVSSRKIKMIGEKINLSDHTIVTRFGEQKISVFNPKKEFRAALAIYCPITKRALKIELIGKYAMEFLENINEIICH